MKQILLIFLVIFSFYSESFATDACDKFVAQEASFIWEVILNARLRDYPCTYKSNILWVSTIWTNYTITQKVDWWYKVELKWWKSAWIRDQAIQKTTLEIQKIQNTYKLTINDRIIINKITNKIDVIIQENWIWIKNQLITKIEQILNEKKIIQRVNTIFEELLIRIKNIEIKEIEEVNDTIINSSSTNDYLNNYNIDLDKVKETWLSWYNTERNTLWKHDYKYNSTLEQSATYWSNISKERWNITHKRSLSDSYYDYEKITSWFKSKWVVCKNIYSVTHTENIWRWTYTCSDFNCTDEFINWIKKTFLFYMSEKDQEYKAHYQSITNNFFKEIWIWFAIEKQNTNYYKYYLTVHYCTELVD